jgi:predicted ATP-dependent serine protease
VRNVRQETDAAWTSRSRSAGSNGVAGSSRTGPAPNVWQPNSYETLSTATAQPPAKAATGITGFDETTGGGLPRGRTTLLSGGPGSGKTIFALRFLVHGAQSCKEPGIFVAFEESADRIVANAAGFGWDLMSLQRRKPSAC